MFDDKTPRKKALYDMIIGMNLMTEIGITVDTIDKVIKWEDNVIPLKTKNVLQSHEQCNMLYELFTATPTLQDAEERQTRILEADYQPVDLNDHVMELTELSTEEKQQLLATLLRYPDLFRGGLGILNIKPVHLELIDGAKPYHAKPFPVPQAYMDVTKKELVRLINEGVFEANHDSEWAAPTFVQPKKKEIYVFSLILEN